MHGTKMLKKVVNRVTRMGATLIYSITAKASDLDVTPEELRGSNTGYRKFVVLAHARSGSSMVIHALQHHPQIVCFGELFVASRISFNTDGYDNYSGKLIYLRNRQPLKFLEKSVFAPYRNDVRAVGFKLFPDQLVSSRFSPVWDWLCSDRDVHVIMLQRRNLLSTYASLLIARKTGNFGISSESHRTDTTISIEFSDCLNEFEKRKKYHEDALQSLQANKVLQVYYEDMVAGLSAQFAVIQEFLGVEPVSPTINSVKKEVRPLSDVITNYDELRGRFSGTEWEYLFEDEAA
jgi:hypothetical protein